MDQIMPVLSAAGTLLLVLAIFAGAYYVSKLVGRRYQKISPVSGRNIEILERMPLGKDQYLLVAKTAGKTYLLGVTANHIEKIDELDAAQILAPPEQNSAAVPDFLHILKKAVGKENEEAAPRKPVFPGRRMVRKHDDKQDG